ncbi:MAG: hypothetical protein DWI22_22990 [Planctomycetota bacterium]|nr:MAG: hypothetical protein DWI22_22990 [Planctomycetota bacterium]
MAPKDNRCTSHNMRAANVQARPCGTVCGKIFAACLSTHSRPCKRYDPICSILALNPVMIQDHFGESISRPKTGF